MAKALDDFYGKEENQEILSQSLLNALGSLFPIPEFQELFGTLLNKPLQEIAQQIMAPMGLNQVDPETDQANEVRADKALGQMIVKGAGDMLPLGAAPVLDKIFPNWEEEATKNPEVFIKLVSKARQLGIFNMFDGILGDTLGVSNTPAINQQTSSSKW